MYIYKYIYIHTYIYNLGYWSAQQFEMLTTEPVYFGGSKSFKHPFVSLQTILLNCSKIIM